MERVRHEGDMPQPIKVLIKMFEKETKGQLKPAVYKTSENEELLKYAVEEDCPVEILFSNPNTVASKAFLVGWGSPQRQPMKDIMMPGDEQLNAVIVYSFIKRSKIPGVRFKVEELRKALG